MRYLKKLEDYPIPALPCENMYRSMLTSVEVTIIVLLARQLYTTMIEVRLYTQRSVGMNGSVSG